MKGLTQRQREVLEDVAARFGATTFTPEQAYPCRDAADNAGRRTLKQLVDKGRLLRAGPFPSANVFQVNGADGPEVA